MDPPTSRSVGRGPTNSSGNDWAEPTIDIADDADVTIRSKPNDDFTPRGEGPASGSDKTSTTAVTSSDDADSGLSRLTIAAIICGCVALVVAVVAAVVNARKASARNEEALFVDLGDESSYTYFSDYAAM
ncbi:hypothetical protein BBJ28_00008351 [Nothophytophthora sp. Chile5]|nr:hypothetical protein BBJ28_00008351 [Nothophytophthora sp. Chile5]